MPPKPGDSAVDAIVAELRVVRERGLARLRHTDLKELSLAAASSSVLAAARGGPGAIEALLRAAIANLGGGSLADAATATFGLGRGGKDRPASVRRQHGALVYGVSTERFRKHHERIVLEQVAEEVLKLTVMARSADRAGAAGLVGDSKVTARVELGQNIALDALVHGVHVPLVIHVQPVELLTDVDILVVPANLYLELPQYFKSSFGAAVRRSAANRSPDGQVVVDVVADELASWLSKHARIGLPTAPGTVAPTSPGELAHQGIRRVYHVAIAVPISGTNDYEVEPTAVARGVRAVFALARNERELYAPALASIGFPLLGAGRGGLHPATSFAWLWSALERDIAENGPWQLHIITRRQQVAKIVMDKLAEAGVVMAAERPD